MFYILKLIELLINILPKVIALKLGALIGYLFFLIDAKHRKLAVSNIKKIFRQEKNQKEINNIARRSFYNIGKNIIEFFRKTPKTFTLIGFDIVEELLERDKRVIFVLGHFGNWELLGRLAISHGIKLVTVGREIKNKGIDRYIKQSRTGSGLELLDKKGSADRLLKALKDNKSVAILIDQYAGRKRGIFVDFFNIPTSTTPSPAVLNLRTNIPIVPVFMIRGRNDEHKIIIENPIAVERSGNINHDININTQKIVKPLEDYIRKYPEQWWWIHRRWR